MVELGQIRQGPPTVVTAVLARGGIGLQGPSVHMEPIPVRRIRTVFHHVMKGPKAAAAVVEHPIQNQPHAALMHIAFLERGGLDGRYHAEVHGAHVGDEQPGEEPLGVKDGP